MVNLILAVLEAAQLSLNNFYEDCLDDVDLAQLHRLQCGLVALGSHAGAAVSDNIDLGLRQSCLCQNRIGQNADTGAKTHQSDFFNTQALIDIE